MAWAGGFTVAAPWLSGLRTCSFGSCRLAQGMSASHQFIAFGVKAAIQRGRDLFFKLSMLIAASDKVRNMTKILTTHRQTQAKMESGRAYGRERVGQYR